MKERTLLLGNGPVAWGIAKALLSENMPVMLVTPDTAASAAADDPTPLLEVCTETRVSHCTGSAGNFQVALGHPHGTPPLSFANIVIAEDGIQRPLFSLYGLSPAPTVLSLSEIRKILASPSASELALSAGKTAVFIVGLAGESYPHVVEAVMESCLTLQTEQGMKTMILTRNLKVGASGLEAMYQKTRDAGVVYVKFSDTLPTFQQDAAGKVGIAFMDDITRMPFTVQADITVVDEAIDPSPYLKDLSRIFCLDMDSARYIQSDNVHRLSVFTNRKGILAAGASRGVLSPSAWQSEVQETAITLLSLIKGTLTTPGNKAEIDAGACVRCLTCFRLCPYHAITLNTRPVVMTDACERCGMCAAECPAKAIRIDDLRLQAVSERLKPMPIKNNNAAFTPFLVAFCCTRSAGRAKELAILYGLSLPDRLSIVEVPCSGSISSEYLLAAFQHQADGVLVFTCHEGNCHSERGNILAARRTVHMKNVLKQIGIDPNRLLLKTLASNMAAEFAENANKFEKQIAKAGPLGINL
ncbi:MAG: hydrogenase iron-sulfur subunit [Deltaproteobacteria bacterium]|nr:hydrogenase iron-sulfur subunit [Deltaproteobacteria bacterium]